MDLILHLEYLLHQVRDALGRLASTPELFLLLKFFVKHDLLLIQIVKLGNSFVLLSNLILHRQEHVLVLLNYLAPVV